MLVLVFSLLLCGTVVFGVYAVWGQVSAETNPVQARLRELRSRVRTAGARRSSST
jgi:hypothetical protein